MAHLHADDWMPKSDPLSHIINVRLKSCVELKDGVHQLRNVPEDGDELRKRQHGEEFERRAPPRAIVLALEADLRRSVGLWFSAHQHSGEEDIPGRIRAS